MKKGYLNVICTNYIVRIIQNRKKSRKMRLLIIANGKINNHKNLISNSDKIICTDGGLNNFAKIHPNLSKIDNCQLSIPKMKILSWEGACSHYCPIKILKKKQINNPDPEGRGIRLLSHQTLSPRTCCGVYSEFKIKI